MVMEINKFPFTETSTMVLTDLGYLMPLEIFVDANFYPRCANNTPFWVSAIHKEERNSSIDVCDSTGSVVFQILVPLRQNTDADYISGYGVQGGSYCGSCLLTKGATDFFAALPSIDNIPSDSLVLSASAVRPIPGERLVQCALTYGGEKINSIEWGDNVQGGTVNNTIITGLKDIRRPITSVTVNGVMITGDRIFITPSRGSSIRLTNTGGISIGRLADL